MKTVNLYIFSLIIGSSTVLGQDEWPVSLFGEVGFGVANSSFPSSNSAINSSLALAVGHEQWMMKYNQKVIGIFSFTLPKEKIRSKDLLVGRSMPLYREFNSRGERFIEWNMVLYTGFSAVQNQSNPTSTINGQTATKTVIENSYGIPVQIEIQYLFPPLYGGSLSLFYNFNRFRDFYGLSVSGVLGYF